MPVYEMKCPSCEEIFELVWRIAEYDNMVNSQYCTKCPTTLLRRAIITPPNGSIPGNCSHDGKSAILGGSGKKEQSRVPINIIDEKPGGGYKVTRIGKKGDIDND